MNKKTIISILVILLLIVGFTFYSSTGSDNENTPREEAVQEDSNRPNINIITKHQYKDGEHAFVSTLDLPSPCHSFNAEVVDVDDKSEIKFNINDPDGGDGCVQVITPTDVKVTYTGPEDRNFTATLNDELVTLNIFEIPVDQDIDTVKLFIKS
ncbi:MAG: hypothetical protein ACI9GH_000050 [Candidatus Paceibacteria bacterium]|jgi:hypothetical protein